MFSSHTAVDQSSFLSDDDDVFPRVKQESAEPSDEEEIIDGREEEEVASTDTFAPAVSGGPEGIQEPDERNSAVVKKEEQEAHERSVVVIEVESDNDTDLELELEEVQIQKQLQETQLREARLRRKLAARNKKRAV